MARLHRAVVVMMDSLGVGAAPDAAEYGDEGTDTLGHTATVTGGLHLPNLEAAGLGNLHGDTEGVPPHPHPSMAWGKMAEASAGKDSTTGHWEMAGVVTTVPQATFTESGFPPELVEAVERDSGHRFVGNYAASGTTIIEDLGPEHMRTGDLILYTSADSVFQIAAHKKVVPLEELYRVCRVARQHCDRYHIGRVIARPFEGAPGSFRRTYERHDFSMEPTAPTLLDHAKEAGLRTFGIGKIEDLFAGRGLTGSVHTAGDADGLQKTVEALADPRPGIVMVNLVDLDMTYGHRENPVGYAAGLALIDRHLPDLVEGLGPDDLLFLSADHGNDPTDGSTDHTREYVPLLVAGRGSAGVELGTRGQFCDIAATIAAGAELTAPEQGVSFWMEVAG